MKSLGKPLGEGFRHSYRSPMEKERRRRLELAKPLSARETANRMAAYRAFSEVTVGRQFLGTRG
jgi:hypothetical protein